MIRSFFAALLLLGSLATPLTAVQAGDSTSGDPPSPPSSVAVPAAIVPAHTSLRFHLTAPVASKTSISGTPFTFVLIDPIVVDGAVLVAAGTAGTGTLILAGHAGTSGHEGDLTLRLDTIPTNDGRQIAFDDQRLRINGRNKKIVSGVLGFIPYVGFGARFIRGADVSIDKTTPITTVLDRSASTALHPPVALATPER